MAIVWHVGDVVKKLREQVGITQGSLAKLAGIRPATLCRIENTGKHDPETLTKISRKLRTTVAAIHAQVPEDISTRPAPETNSGVTCDQHKELHRYFERILHEGGPMAEWLAASMVAFHEHLETFKGPGGPPPAAQGKKHGPFAHKTQMEPGDKVQIIRRSR